MSVYVHIKLESSPVPDQALLPPLNVIHSEVEIIKLSRFRCRGLLHVSLHVCCTSYLPLNNHGQRVVRALTKWLSLLNGIHRNFFGRPWGQALGIHLHKVVLSSVPVVGSLVMCPQRSAQFFRVGSPCESAIGARKEGRGKTENHC